MKKIVLAACALVCMVGFIWLPHLVFAAELQYDLYINQKIFYYHVPAAFMQFLAVFVCGIASILYLAKARSARWDDVASAAGDLAVLFGALLLTSGPIWGKAAWGHYWVWDARLTQSLLLWTLFIGYALLRRYGGLGSERLAAGLAIFGMANVPMIYFAVTFWKTQHPTNDVVPNLTGGMRTAFLVSLLSYLLLFILLLAAHVSVGRWRRRFLSVKYIAMESE